jgi:hypothetical protein
VFNAKQNFSAHSTSLTPFTKQHNVTDTATSMPHYGHQSNTALFAAKLTHILAAWYHVVHDIRTETSTPSLRTPKHTSSADHSQGHKYCPCTCISSCSL